MGFAQSAGKDIAAFRMMNMACKQGEHAIHARALQQGENDAWMVITQFLLPPAYPRPA
jgi:hypothetical protein